MNAYFLESDQHGLRADDHLSTPHELPENHKVLCLPDNVDAYKGLHTKIEFPKQQKNRI